MRKLLNTLFVLTESSYLTLDGETVVVKQGDAEAARFPLHTLEGILCFSYAGASPALMGACAQRNVDLAFFTPRGRFLARSVGETKGNVLLRQQQFRAADDPGVSCRYAKGFLLGKIYNARWVLERATRDHPQRVPVERLKTLSGQLAAALPRVEDAMTAEELRGIEGEAAQLYFSGFDALILQQRPTFAFSKRTRRPPLDPVNALLSFAYTLLARDCAAALEGVGLDPYVGFLHQPRPGRTSLALDLMEELRASFADRFVLTCINQKTILPKHCVNRPSSTPFWVKKSPGDWYPMCRLCCWPVPCGATWIAIPHFSGNKESVYVGFGHLRRQHRNSSRTAQAAQGCKGLCQPRPARAEFRI